MTTQNQTVEIKESGGTIKIPLEDWAENLIDRALEKHVNKCPFFAFREGHEKFSSALDKRIGILELQIRLMHWLIGPIYLIGIGWFLNRIFELI